ncbi:hypothetical protein FOL47_007218 [Perkinsus chesapeaki]|uniref:Uncharacterized protein n=1 Tax=Perkinsus chesapeaki TaxID=330153 RepID=A0A7J6LM18_PERCH|nr:hypothetical protein FOL47_007218 [Perkinsus chesapeaki]
MGSQVSKPTSDGIVRTFAREYSSPECSWKCDLLSRLPVDGAHSSSQLIRELTANVSATVKVPASCPAGITIEAESVATQMAKSLCRSLASTAGSHAMAIGDSALISTTRTCSHCTSSTHNRSWWLGAACLTVVSLLASAGVGAAAALYWMGATREDMERIGMKILGKSSQCAEKEDSPEPTEAQSAEDVSPNNTSTTSHADEGWDKVC